MTERYSARERVPVPMLPGMRVHDPRAFAKFKPQTLRVENGVSGVFDEQVFSPDHTPGLDIDKKCHGFVKRAWAQHASYCHEQISLKRRPCPLGEAEHTHSVYNVSIKKMLQYLFGCLVA